MARINLLPWRDAERKRRQKELGIIAGAMLLLTLLAGGIVHWQMAEQIGAQQDRNAFLQSEINLLNRRIKEIRDLEETKAKLLARTTSRPSSARKRTAARTTRARWPPWLLNRISLRTPVQATPRPISVHNASRVSAAALRVPG